MKPVRWLTVRRDAGWFALNAFALALGTGSAADDWAQRVRLSFQLGFNIDARFQLGGDFSVSSGAPGPAGVGGVDHFYDDGYVRVDPSGNAQGYTAFWGYENAGQYDAVSQTLTFNSADTYRLANTTGTAASDPAPGFELIYGMELKRWGKVQLGAEAGGGLLAVRVREQQSLPAVVARTVHRFNAGGIQLPDAPYSAGPAAIGPLIQDVATALPGTTEMASFTGSQELESYVWSLRLGPTLRWDVHPRCTIAAGAGLAVAFVAHDYYFEETLRFNDGSQALNSGNVGRTETLLGAYANLLVLFHISEDQKPVDLFAGVQWMGLPDSTIQSSGREAELHLGGTLSVQAGINWMF